MSNRFVKYHGLGNDFILVDARHRPELAGMGELAVAVCDRHQGVGADGLVFVLPAQDAHFTMHIFNSDGSIARMCGNGIRCFTRFVYDEDLWDGEGDLVVRTASGLRTTHIVQAEPGQFLVRVNMQPPRLDPADIPTTLGPTAGHGPVLDVPLEVNGQTLAVTCVSTGNTHAVIFVPDLDQVDLLTLGPAVERHPAFPQRTNVHFVQVLDPYTLQMRTWERGAGLTLACGTGACAATVAAALTGRAGRRCTVYVPGGHLNIDWREDTDDVYMTGPATRVFEGEVSPEWVGVLAQESA